MTDETASAPVPLRARVRHGLGKPQNWLQLGRFGAVGLSGYVVNLLVYAIAVGPLDADYRLAAVVGWMVAVLNNFLWNRRWTFAASDGHAGFQGARFFVVSLGSLLVNLVVLELLVVGFDVAEVQAQAIAIVVATPCNFLGNKLWTFDR